MGAVATAPHAMAPLRLPELWAVVPGARSLPADGAGGRTTPPCHDHRALGTRQAGAAGTSPLPTPATCTAVWAEQADRPRRSCRRKLTQPLACQGPELSRDLLEPLPWPWPCLAPLSLGAGNTDVTSGPAATAPRSPEPVPSALQSGIATTATWKVEAKATDHHCGGGKANARATERTPCRRVAGGALPRPVGWER